MTPNSILTQTQTFCAAEHMEPNAAGQPLIPAISGEEILAVYVPQEAFKRSVILFTGQSISPRTICTIGSFTTVARQVPRDQAF